MLDIGTSSLCQVRHTGIPSCSCGSIHCNNVIWPHWWFNKDVHDSDKASLYRKDTTHYKLFKKYNRHYPEYVWPVTRQLLETEIKTEQQTNTMTEADNITSDSHASSDVNVTPVKGKRGSKSSLDGGAALRVKKERKVKIESSVEQQHSTSSNNIISSSSSSSTVSSTSLMLPDNNNLIESSSSISSVSTMTSDQVKLEMPYSLSLQTELSTPNRKDSLPNIHYSPYPLRNREKVFKTLLF